MALPDFKYAALQTAAVATGNGTLFEVAGYGSIGFQVVIATTATITFEFTIDGANWLSLPVINTSGARVTTATASGAFWANIAGVLRVRARVSAWTSGNVDCAALASKAPLPIMSATVLSASDGTDIGSVDVLSIAAGDNNIGNVDLASAIPAGTNAIGKLAANSGVDIGDVDVTSIAAGTNLIGQMVPASHATLGGLSAYHNAALSNTAVAVKASAGQLYGIDMSNALNSTAYVQFFDVAQGSVTVGTTAPTFVISGPTAAATFATRGVQIPLGITMGTAITAASTTTATGNTGAAQVVAILYK